MKLPLPPTRAIARRVILAVGITTLFAPDINASTLYWDGNGATIGAGTAPAGTWGTSAFWNSSSAGTSGAFTTLTTLLDDLVFSAGTTATGAYAVTVNGTRNARLLTIEEGTPTFSGGTITLGSAGGITLATGAGNAIVSSSLSLLGPQTFTVGDARTLALNTGTFIRSAGAVLNIQLGAGSALSSSMTGLSANNAGGIVGTWATVDTGTNTRYATFSGSNIVALTGTAAATAADLTDTTGLVNYDLAAATGSVPATVSANTIRYTGAVGTTAPGATSFSVNGLLNAGSGTWTIGTNTLTIGADRELGINTASDNITISSAIANNGGGSSGLTKTGTNTLLLSGSGANTYTGLTTVAAGILSLGKTGGANALRGDLAVSGGAKVIFGNSGAQDQIINTAAVTINGSGSVFNGTTFGSTVGAVGVQEQIGSLTITDGHFNTGSSSVWTITGAGVFDATNGDVRFTGFSASQTSFGSLSLKGLTGTATSSANSFVVAGNSTTTSSLTVGSGGLTLDGSRLVLNRDNTGGSRLVLNGNVTTAGTSASFIQFGSVTTGPATLQLSSTAGTHTRTFTVGDNGANLTITVDITNGTATTGGIIKDGAGTLSLQGTNTFTGTTTISTGTLSINSTAALPGWDTNGRFAVASGATLAVTNGVSDGQIAIMLGTTNFSAGAALGFDPGSGDRTYSAVIADTTQGALGVTKSGSNALILDQANTYTGATTILAGVLAANTLADGGVASSIGSSSSNAANLVLGGGTLQYTGGSQSTNRNFTLVAGITSTIEVVNAATTLTLSGSSAATTGGFNKAGDGTLTFTSSQAHTGTTAISGGTLILTGAGALANTSAVNLSGTGVVFDITAISASSETVGSLAGVAGATVLLGSKGLVAGGANTSTTFSGTLDGTGSGTLTKSGNGILTLGGTAANTYTGLTTVNGGTLNLAKTAGTAAIAGNLAIDNAFVTFGASNQIADTATVTMSGATSVFNGNGVNAGLGTIQETIGGLTVTGGTFNTSGGGDWTITGAASFSGGAGKIRFVGNSGSSVTFGSLSLSGMTSLNESATTATSAENSFTLYGNATTRSSITVGSGGLSLDGSVFNLRNANSTPGGLGSRLILDGNITTVGTTASQIRDQTGVAALVGSEISIDLSSMAGSFIRTIDVGGGGADLAIGVPIVDGTTVAGITGGIAKSGAGTLTLTAANTYTGATAVSQGKLLVSGSITGSTATVSAGATLGGTGTIGGTGSLDVNGTLAPGSSAGKLTVTKSVNFNTGSTFALELDGTAAGVVGGYDQLAASGAIQITGMAQITLTLGFAPMVGQTFTVIDNTGPAISGTFSNLADGGTISAMFAAQSYSFTANYAGGDGNDLVLQAVPEPGSLIALLGGFALLAGGRFRRRGRR